MKTETEYDEMADEFKRLCKVVDGFNDAVQFLRDNGSHVELRIQDDGKLRMKVDGVLLDDTG